MRILYFHQHFCTPSGSSGTRSYEFAKALVARGHQVTMVCGNNASSGLALPFDGHRGWSRGDIDGIDVISLPVPYSNRAGLFRRTCLFLRFAWRSIRIALREKYDILFATSTPLTAALPGIFAKVLRRVPFVFEVRDLWPELPKALGLRNPILLGGMSILEWSAYRACDRAIGLSPGIVEGIRNRSPDGLPVEMIPNGCDLEMFNPGLRGPLNLTGIRAGDFVAGFTGAHGPANGLDTVLDAAAVLKERGIANIKVAFIGDGKEKERLAARAKAEGLNNCLFFPPMPKGDLARVTASLGCGLMVLKDVPAFYFGTSPNKFFDYISAGIPVVNNYSGWLAALIRENHCGIAVSGGDPVALADALLRLSEDSALCANAANSARLLAESSFDRKLLAARFCEWLEALPAAPN